MAHLWSSLRVAVRRLRISRTRRKRVSKIRVYERIERRRLVSRWITSPSSAACCSTFRNELKQMLLVRYRSSSSSSASLTAASKCGSDVGLLSSGEDDENNVVTTDLDENSSEHDVDESVPLVPVHRQRFDRSRSSNFARGAGNMERGSFSLDLSSLDLGSPDWEKTILVSSISMRPAFRPGDPDISSRSHFHHHRLDNRDWRLNYRSPQLMQPVRWRLATLSGLLRTVSDRYARRTGELTPMHEKRRKQPLAKCFSSSQWVRPTESSSTSANSSRAADLALRRYDNPYQDFLKRAMEERNARLAKVKALAPAGNGKEECKISKSGNACSLAAA